MLMPLALNFGTTTTAARNKSTQASLVKEPFFAMRYGELFHGMREHADLVIDTPI
jgi:hypothetical protein